MHHGVKGMKWGVRHDPQRTGRISARRQYKNAKREALKKYARAADRLESQGRGNDLDANMKIASQYDAERKKAKQDYQNAKKDNPLLTPKQKQIAKKIAIGAAVVAGVGLATYGGVKLSSTRSYNRASIAKFLDNNPEIANSVLQGGKPYKSHVERVINPFGNGLQIKGGSTVSVGKIKNTIKGPSLKTSQSTVNAYRTNYYNRPGEKSRDAVSKYLEKDVIGANGRSLYFNKEQRKYYNKRYKDYVSKSLRQTWV